MLFSAPSMYWQNIDEVLLLAVEWWVHTSIQTPIYTFKTVNTRIYLKVLFFFTSSLFRNTTIFSSYVLMNIFSFIFCAPETTFFEQVQCIFYIVNNRQSSSSSSSSLFFFHKIRQKKAAELLLLKKYINACFNFFFGHFSFLCLWFIKRKNNTYVLKKDLLLHWFLIYWSILFN